MQQSPDPRSSRTIFGSLILSITILGILVFYALFPAIIRPTPGVTYGLNNYVVDLPWCAIDLVTCEYNHQLIEVGDQLLKVGNVDLDPENYDRTVATFIGYRQGDYVPITFNRNGVIQEVLWRLPEMRADINLINSITPLLIALPFWIVGTALLFYVSNHDKRWRLLIAFNYLTAIWVVTGLASASRVAYSSIVLHAISWLLVPVYLHLHLEIPSSIGGHRTKLVIASLYVINSLLALLEIFQLLPDQAYFIGLIVAILGSLGILIYRLLTTTSTADKLASRIMASGILISFGPGLLLFILPSYLIEESPSEFSTALAMLAIPIMPLFYSYAVYKRHLGIREGLINRILTVYAIFLVYVVIIAIAVLATNQWVEIANEITILGLIVSTSIIFTALPIQSQIERLIGRLAYGTAVNRSKLYEHFASQVPAAKNPDEIATLLADDLCPSLKITQSALIYVAGEALNFLYQQNSQLQTQDLHLDNLDLLLERANEYIPPGNGHGADRDYQFDWVRLIIPLQGHTEINAYWLFGQRFPDDFYSSDDIELLSSLAKQLAITLENGRLWIALQRQLSEREEAEKKLTIYADRLAQLHQLDNAFLAAETPFEIAEVANKAILNMLKCTRSSVTLFDFPNNQMIWLAVSDGRPEYSNQGEQKKGPMPELYPDTLAGQSVIIPDVNSPEVPESVRDDMKDSGLSSLMAIPLVIDEALIGTLNIGQKEVNSILPEYVTLAEDVANSLVLALYNARLREQITQHSRNLKRLSTQLINAQEVERKRISYELHDEIGQLLTAIMFDLATIGDELNGSETEQVINKLADAKSLVEQLTGQVRSMSLDLRPSMLHDLGLLPTVRWYINRYAERRQMDIQFETVDMDARYSDEVETAIYRVVQEALTNVSKHAEAENVRVRLARNDSLIEVTIEDDGRGFDVKSQENRADPARGIGLLAIRERVTALEGELNIQSAPNQGTRIYVQIPLKDKT